MMEPQQHNLPSTLAGLTILMVEDEAIVSLLLEDMLLDMGCAEVLLASDVKSALGILATRRPDVAVLDVNLAGVPAYPIAERLAAMSVPFVFATGYGRFGIESPWVARPVIQKPYDMKALRAVLGSALGTG